MLAEIVGEDHAAGVTVTGHGSLPAVFPVSELATATVAAAAVSVRDLLVTAGSAASPVTVDRRLASMWFASSLRPQGWQPPPPWDPIAGDYQSADGWIRLHTNAPAHRDAALAVLAVAPDRAQVTRAVAAWAADALEDAVVTAGGCAAAMHTLDQWTAMPAGRSVAAEPLISWHDTGRGPQRRLRLDPARPLHGVRVLDLTRVLAGPVATRFLAQLGADVLRVDPPWWEEPGLVPEVMLGKRSTRLDLRQAASREQFLELVAGADVLVHGYRPGALDSLDLGEAVRRDARPGLIEVSLDAYGWTGPWAPRRGFDSLVQMSTGIADAGMRRAGHDKPTPLPVQALDHATGYLMAHAAITALTTRVRTGRGSHARLSLARTARLLTASGSSGPGSPLRTEDESDIAPAIEQTSWGPARRLRPAVSVGGVEFRTDRPARELGGDRAAW